MLFPPPTPLHFVQLLSLDFQIFYFIISKNLPVSNFVFLTQLVIFLYSIFSLMFNEFDVQVTVHHDKFLQ